jgi:hypothetical protein
LRGLFSFVLLSSAGAPVGAALPPAPTPAATPTAETPEALYLRALTRLRELPRPRVARYRVRFEARNARLICTDGRTVIDFGRGDDRRDERVEVTIAGGAATRTDVATGETCSGVPLLSPDGGDIAALVATSARPSAEVQTAPLPVLGAVRVESVLYYRITGAEPETIDGAPAVHLMLRAIADPAAHPLTDLWIDPDSALVRRVRGAFTDAYGGVTASIVATGAFALCGPYWVQTSEHVAFDAPTEPRATAATLDAVATDYEFP